MMNYTKNSKFVEYSYMDWTEAIHPPHLTNYSLYKHSRERIRERLVFSVNELEYIICLPTDFKRPQAATL